MKRNLFRQLIVIVVFSVVVISDSYSQQKADIGFWGGYSFYMGDMNKNKLFISREYALGGMYRYHFNNRYTLRFSAGNVLLSGTDQTLSSSYPYRTHSFKTSLTEFAIQVEFNFFPFSVGSKYDRISPYVISGVGGFMGAASDGNFNFNLSVPFGIGVTAAVTDRITAGVEWSFRATNSDRLDQLEATKPDTGNKQMAFEYNNDWYSIGFIYIAYKFYEGDYRCRAYGRPMDF